MKRFYFLAAIACFFLCPAISADAKDVLADINNLFVTVVHTGEEPNGIIWDELKNQINTRLIQAGIKVFLPEPGVMYKLPLWPELNIRVDMLKLEQSQQYVFHIQTSLAKSIYTDIEHPMRLYADVWKTDPVMKVVLAGNIRTEIIQEVMEQVDKLISAHQVRLSDANDANTVSEAVKEPLQQIVTQPAAEYQYVASKNRPVFHRPDCSLAARIKPANLITFKSADDAIRTGRRPCKLCKP